MRRPLDKYFTPADAVLALKEHVIIRGRVFEPCAGEGHIAKHFEDCLINDIEYGEDARLPGIWSRADKECEWAITNPPFMSAFEILQRAFETSLKIAFLLRLSFLEPTKERANFLAKNPPSKLIVLPRISFTGDGKTDNVTCAWMVWRCFDDKPIIVTTRFRA